MNAEKTRNFLAGLCNGDEDIYSEYFKELDEFERLAEIGKAVEKAFNTREGVHDETVIVVSGHTEDGGWIGYATLKSINELVDWSKSK